MKNKLKESNFIKKKLKKKNENTIFFNNIMFIFKISFFEFLFKKKKILK
jgi:hypothetical protein